MPRLLLVAVLAGLPLGGCPTIDGTPVDVPTPDDPSPPEEPPDAWTCVPQFFASLDGCDCGCGVPDPDCGTSATCDFVHCGQDEALLNDLLTCVSLPGTGEMVDGGPPLDAGLPRDAGPPADSGGPADNGTVPDAGAPHLDDGGRPDASLVDGGPSDAGDGPPTCLSPAATCGNGVVDVGEFCDDGVNDGVRSPCTPLCDAAPGTLTPIAGARSGGLTIADGVPALEAHLEYPQVRVADDGRVFLRGNYAVFAIDDAGLLRQVVGSDEWVIGEPTFPAPTLEIVIVGNDFEVVGQDVYSASGDRILRTDLTTGLTHLVYDGTESDMNIYKLNVAPWGEIAFTTDEQVFRVTGPQSAELVAGVQPSYTPNSTLDEGHGVPATEAIVRHPREVLFHPSGDLFIANHAMIRRVDTAGIIWDFAGAPDYDNPYVDPVCTGNSYGLAWDAADLCGWGGILRLTAEGDILTVARVRAWEDGERAEVALTITADGNAADVQGGGHGLALVGGSLEGVGLQDVIGTDAS